MNLLCITSANIMWLSPDEEWPANQNFALLALCRKMPYSGPRQHQSQRPRQSRLAAQPLQLLAATLLQQAQLWPPSARRRQLNRRAATLLRRLLLPVETMMVTLNHTLLTICAFVFLITLQCLFRRFQMTKEAKLQLLTIYMSVWRWCSKSANPSAVTASLRWGSEIEKSNTKWPTLHYLHYPPHTHTHFIVSITSAALVICVDKLYL